MGYKTPIAHWDKNRKRWKVQVQRDGERKAFYSRVPGQMGKKEAEQMAENWKKRLPLPERSSVPTVEQLWEKYLAYQKEERGVSTSTWDQNRKFGRNYILPICGKLKISELNEGHLQKMLDMAAKQGCLRKDNTRCSGPLSKKTLGNIRNSVNRFVKWCRINEYTNLKLEGLEFRSLKLKKEKQILQPDELRTLFAVDTRVVRGKRQFDDMIYSYRFAVVTGLRPGELMGLRICDIRKDKICIRQAINRYDEVTPGKNDNARREFGINRYARVILAQQLEMLQRQGIVLHPEQLVFPALNQQSRYHRWKSYAESNGVKAVSCYELRHTFISMANNLQDGDLRSLVGHSMNMDTRGVYAHKLVDDDVRIAGELDKIIAQVLGDLQPEKESGVPK